MRAVILILIVVILAIIAAIATGFLDINQIRGAQAPEITATHNGVSPRAARRRRSMSRPARSRSAAKADDGEGAGARGPEAAAEPGRRGDQQRAIVTSTADRRGRSASRRADELSRCRRRCAARSTLPAKRPRPAKCRSARWSRCGEEIVAEARNAMRGSIDPTAHAEMEAIRAAADEARHLAARRMHLVGDAGAVRDVRGGDRRSRGSRRCASPPRTPRAAAWSTARASSPSRPAITGPTCSAGSARRKRPSCCAASSPSGASRGTARAGSRPGGWRPSGLGRRRDCRAARSRQARATRSAPWRRRAPAR